jgi:hypothetical protein
VSDICLAELKVTSSTGGVQAAERLLDPRTVALLPARPRPARRHLPLAHHQQRQDGLHAEALLQPC